jgi:hypothetical protein
MAGIPGEAALSQTAPTRSKEHALAELGWAKMRASGFCDSGAMTQARLSHFG